MTERRRRGRFLLGWLIYLLILALILGAALYVLRDFLTYYEASRPARALEQYRGELAADGPGESAREALSALDFRLQSEDEALALAAARLEGARLREDISQSGEDSRVYRILADGSPCGSLTIRTQEAQRYGFAPWTPAERSYDFSRWFYTLSVTVPSGWTVACGDTVLTEDYITERGIPYRALRECYEHYEGLPAMVRYETGLLFADRSLHVYDAEGREVPAERQNEDAYLDNCGGELRERMRAYAEEFVAHYVSFTSVKGDYWPLNAMIVKGSPLATRIEQAVGEDWWSRTAYCNLLDCRVNRCVDLGEGRYLLDFSYDTETKAFDDPVTTTYNVRLVLFDSGGTLLANNMFNY